MKIWPLVSFDPPSYYIDPNDDGEQIAINYYCIKNP